MLTAEQGALTSIFISLISIFVNILLWLFPDQYFSMKSIYRRLTNEKQIQEFMRFKSIHRRIMPLQRFFVICVIASSLEIITLLVTDGRMPVAFTGLLAFIIPFIWNCFKLVQTWQIFAKDIER